MIVRLGSGGEDSEGLLRRRRRRRRRGEGDAEEGEAAVVEVRTGAVDSGQVGEVEIEEEVEIGPIDGEAEEVEIVAGRATEEVRVTVAGGVQEGALRTGAVEVEAEVTTARQARRAATSRRRAAISSRSTEGSSAVVSKGGEGGGGGGSRAWEEKSGAGTGAWNDRCGAGTEGMVTRTREGAPRRELRAGAGARAGTGTGARAGTGAGAGAGIGERVYVDLVPLSGKSIGGNTMMCIAIDEKSSYGMCIPIKSKQEKNLEYARSDDPFGAFS